MARETVNLYEDQQDFGAKIDRLEKTLMRLQADFDAHNHDGTSSQRLENILARTIQVQSAIIGGYKLYEATVGPTQSDYKTVAEAILAGKRRIFVRNGTYNAEPAWTLSNGAPIITGESLAGVRINFATNGSSPKRCITVSTPNAIFQNLNLVEASETTAQNLFYFDTGGTYPTIENCNLKARKGAAITSNSLALMGTFRNVYVDMTSSNDTTNSKGAYNLSLSSFSNVTFDLTGNSTSNLSVVDTVTQSKFIGCSITSNQAAVVWKIVSSLSSTFTGCFFKMVQILVQSVFDNCIFQNNGSSPTAGNYFLDIDTFGGRVNNCTLNLNLNSDDALLIEASNVQFNNNYISLGKKVLINNAGATIKGSSFSNNIWVSSYNTAAIDLTLGSNADNMIVFGNVIRNNNAGASFTPTITDSGTNDTVTPNKLIQG